MTKRIIFLVLLATTSLHGQNWLLTGSPGILPTDFLGSTNVIPLNFRTTNLQRLQIASVAFGAPLFPGSGINNTMPGNRPGRVAISYDANAPIANPLSKLQLD